MLGNIAQLNARNLHKIIQADLTWDRRIRLHENNKANQEIIFWRNNFIHIKYHIKFLHFSSSPSPYCFLFLQKQVITSYTHNFLKEGGSKYALRFSEKTK